MNLYLALLLVCGAAHVFALMPALPGVLPPVLPGCSMMTMMMCKPIPNCLKFKVDANQCQTCECEKTECPMFKCAVQNCLKFKRDANDCQTCECEEMGTQQDPKTCNEVLCPAGQQCQMTPCAATAEGNTKCLSQPTCVEINTNPCPPIRCASGATTVYPPNGCPYCKYLPDQPVLPPAQPTCGAQGITCEPGHYCMRAPPVAVNCLVYPCPAVAASSPLEAKCVPCPQIRCAPGATTVSDPRGCPYCQNLLPQPVLPILPVLPVLPTCKDTKCEKGFYCKIVHLLSAIRQCLIAPCPGGLSGVWVPKCEACKAPLLPCREGCKLSNPDVGCPTCECQQVDPVKPVDQVFCTMIACSSIDCEVRDPATKCIVSCGGCSENIKPPCPRIACSCGESGVGPDGCPICVCSNQPVDPVGVPRPYPKLPPVDPAQTPSEPISTCMNVKCAAGQHCEMQTVMCIRAPCNPVPKCVDDSSPAEPSPRDQKPPVDPAQQPSGSYPTCENTKCEDGQKCVMQQVQCFAAPCNLVPTCVNSSPAELSPQNKEPNCAECVAPCFVRGNDCSNCLCPYKPL